MQEATNVEIASLITGGDEAIDQAGAMLERLFAEHPEWAEAALPFLASGQPVLAAAARRVLTLFDEDALITIARGFSVDDATARFHILGVLWAHLIGMSARDRSGWLEEVAPHVRPGLSDSRVPNRGLADPDIVEMENDYRLCDETYLFLNRMLADDFDDSLFATMDEDGRNAVVQQFDRRFDNLFGQPKAAAKKAAGKPAALDELTVIARFDSPFGAGDAQAERDKATMAKWAPTTRDFRAVAEVDSPLPAIFEVGSFFELLSIVLFVDPSKPDSSAFRPL
jgi:hypothetical protein